MQRRTPSESLVEDGRIGRRDPRGVEVAKPAFELERAGECFLDRHLLVEREADDQGQRLGDEQAVGLRVTGEMQAIDGHVRMVSDGCAGRVLVGCRVTWTSTGSTSSGRACATCPSTRTRRPTA